MTDIDISPEAVERMACILDGRGGFVKGNVVVATLRALSAALTQSRAERAAAYERAAEAAIKYRPTGPNAKHFVDVLVVDIATAILALRDKPAPAVTVQGELQESREYAQALEVELRDRTAKIERECKLAEAQVSRLLDLTNRMDDRLNALVSATEALGAMPEGYCFCSENRIGDDSKTHEPECEGLRSALRAIAGVGDE